MTIKLSSKGGGGSFVSKFASASLIILTGATGTLVTLTPPAGQRVKITALAANTATMSSLTTITVGGIDVVSDVILQEENSTPALVANQFLIGFLTPNQDPIMGDIDEIIEIKTNVSTDRDISYAYQFGV